MMKYFFILTLFLVGCNSTEGLIEVKYVDKNGEEHSEWVNPEKIKNFNEKKNHGN